MQRFWAACIGLCLLLINGRLVRTLDSTDRPPASKASTRSSTSTTTTTTTTTTESSRPNEHDYLPSFDDFLHSTTGRHVSCNASQFQCENGRQCIHRSHLCDHIQHCDDGSDEGGKCDECQFDNGGCEHLCRNNPNGAECQCHVGWRRSHDGISCEDEDECSSGRGHCQHFCHNTQGGYTCSCAPGYTLLEDGSTCQLVEHDAGFLLFSVDHQIRNLPLNSWHELTPREMPDTAVMCDVRSGTVEGLDTNSNSGHFYYTRRGGIYAHYEAEVCLVQGLYDFGTNVAVDWVTGNLYFINENPAIIGLCSGDGRFCTTLAKRDHDLGTPRGMALHPKFGLMFWTDWGDKARIERANMDGTDRRVIVDTRLAWPNALAVDYVHNLIYFSDSEFKVIERVRLDGSHRELVVKSGVFHPYDLVVFDDQIFWTDWGLYGVMTSRISNTSQHRSLYHSADNQPLGIGILHPVYQDKELPNPCKEAKCSHICALSTTEYGHGRVHASCLCPLNYEYRDDKKIDCTPTTNRTVKTGARWCLDAFVSACQDGKACKNGGACKIDVNEQGLAVGARCECPYEYAGDFCEVALDPSMVGAGLGGTKLWVAAILIFLTFVLVTSLGCVVLRRYWHYKENFDFSSKLHAVRWSPSVIFRWSPSVMAVKNVGDCEQRQRIISTTEDGSSKEATMCKADSFANPVYEEVQVPVHQHASSIPTRANSILSHDSDADSGLEFNTSSGSP